MEMYNTPGQTLLLYIATYYLYMNSDRSHRFHLFIVYIDDEYECAGI